MPEGHLLHRYAREHEASLTGEPLAVSSPQGRFVHAAELDGGELRGAEAWGKHLFHRWAGGAIVHVHLGMQGSFVHHAPPAPPAPRSVRMRIAGSRLVVDLIAPARCERIGASMRARILARLGPDPLRDADPAPAFDRIAASDRPIGALLLDQSVLAGVGNVLRAEVLFLCGVAPSRPGRELSRAELEVMWSTLVGVMRDARDRGRIVTRPPARERRKVPDRYACFVYRQERCGRCGTPVATSAVGERTMYSCPRCQPR